MARQTLSFVGKRKNCFPQERRGKRHSGVLISEEDWNAIQETLHLTSIPNMREWIIEGMKTPVEECDEDLDW